MNLYDFDGTIYDGDSCVDLVKYGLKHYPSLTLKSLLKARKLNKKYKRGEIEFERVKQRLMSFIFKIPNYPRFLNRFVASHMDKIKPWYKSRILPNDVIVTASYEIWINIFARRLGVKYVVATKTDSIGKIIGKNCKGDEKVRRVREAFPDTPINACYGDSKSDEPMLNMCENSFVVEGKKTITYYPGYKFKKLD